jgi:hypothetical protein
VGDPN